VSHDLAAMVSNPDPPFRLLEADQQMVMARRRDV